MNFEQARYNMIKQQFKPWHVSDQRTIDLVTDIHREDFIPEAYKELALADTSVPLLHDQVTMAPKIEARMIQSVEINENDKILEIGTGCGYVTALLASLGKTVTSVDLFPEFAEMARPGLEKYGLKNINLVTGDAVRGWPDEAPYDVIVITGSVPVLEDCYQEQLAINGRLFVIVGAGPAMEVTLVRRLGEKEWSSDVLFETEVPPLLGASGDTSFNF